MPAHGTFPLQLVNQIIDELGKAYRNNYDFPDRRGNTYTTLRACTLMSKRFTARSRAHMFKKIKIQGGKHTSPITPPASILPYVKELEVYYDHRDTKATPISEFLKAFVTAPIECLVITGRVLVGERACIQESIDAHSATLQTVEFQSCELSAYNIVDVLMGRHRPKSLRLADCVCEQHPPPGQPLIADTLDPNVRSKTVELELGISGGDPFEGSADIIAMVARLPYRFTRLDVEHVVTGEGTTEATNALIKANADELSSLQVHFLAQDMEIDVEPEHLFSLEDCSGLSELTLDMENSESSVVRDTISVLSTLNPARLGHLERIVLKANYVGRWFNKDGQPNNDEDDQADGDEDSGDEDSGGEDSQADVKEDWEGFDKILFKLANASTSTRGKRLTFVLVVVQFWETKNLMQTVRKWLPKLLPCFNELGLLHVHHQRGGLCRTVDDSHLSHDKPDCLKEDFQDGC